ncbi:hypothetical protein Emed_006780 [Eimeria media]
MGSWRTSPTVHAPEEGEKELAVVEEEPGTSPTVHAAEEGGKELAVVEEEPGTPPTVHAPEEPEKGLPVVEEEPGTPPTVHAAEEGEKELAVVEEKPGERPLGETPGGPEIEPEVGEGEPGAPQAEEAVKERRLAPEFKQVLDKIVDWARQQHTDKPLSMREALDISYRQTAAELKEKLPEFFEESIVWEEKVRSSKDSSIVSNGFGDQENGRINMAIRGEFPFALSWLDFPLGVLLPK